MIFHRALVTINIGTYNFKELHLFLTILQQRKLCAKQVCWCSTLSQFLSFLYFTYMLFFIFSILHSLLMTSKSAQMTSGIIETLLHLSESKSIVSMELLSQCIKILSTRTLVTSDILTHGKLMKLVANMIRNLSEENVKSTSKPDENQTKGKNPL